MRTSLSINEILKDLRVEKHLHLDELSSAISIPKATLGDYEKDGYSVPHTAVIVLAEYYGVTTDYLLGVSESRHLENIPIRSLHLSDKAMDTIRDSRINSRLLSELIAHKAFPMLLADTEIYVDGFIHEAIGSYSSLMQYARKELADKHGDFSGSVSSSLDRIGSLQDWYFSHLLAGDLLPILDDIKEAHKKDPETSDGAYTLEELIQIADAARNPKKGSLERLAGAILSALRIKATKENISHAASFLETKNKNETAIANLMGKSKIIEPNDRRRRRKNKKTQ